MQQLFLKEIKKKKLFCSVLESVVQIKTHHWLYDKTHSEILNDTMTYKTLMHTNTYSQPQIIMYTNDACNNLLEHKEFSKTSNHMIIQLQINVL